MTDDLFPFATRNEETYTTFNPVFARRLADTLSIGGGITFNHPDVDLRHGLYFSGIAPCGAYKTSLDALALSVDYRF